jgi:hypothetical protein
MVTKSLRADYADPARIAHKALADRITLRDPGNAPAAGDRIGYIYILPKPGQEASKLQGERIETPTFIKENQMVPDYKHYIEHQLQNPISQAFGILLERIPGFHRTWLDKCPMDMDSAIVFRESKAAEVLFQESLKRLEAITQRTGIRQMFKIGMTVTSKETKEEKKEKEKEEKKEKEKEKKKENEKEYIPPKKQLTMSAFLMDSMLVEKMKKSRKKKETKEKETKEKVKK